MLWLSEFFNQVVVIAAKIKFLSGIFAFALRGACVTLASSV